MDMKVINIFETAQTALDKAKGDVTKGTEILIKQAMRDKALYFALTEEYLPQACYQKVSACIRAKRSAITRAANNYDPTQRGDRLRKFDLSLLDQPLPPHGKPLGLCTRAEIIEAVRIYSAYVDDMQHKVRFLQAVAAKVKGNRTADKFIKPETAQQLWDSVKLPDAA